MQVYRQTRLRHDGGLKARSEAMLGGGHLLENRALLHGLAP
jgi:hypothetical protein